MKPSSSITNPITHYLSSLPEELQPFDNRDLQEPREPETPAMESEQVEGGVSAYEDSIEPVPVMKIAEEYKHNTVTESKVIPGGLTMISLYRGSSDLSRRIVSGLGYKLKDVRRALDRQKLERALHCVLTNISDWLDRKPEDRDPSGLAVKLSQSAFTVRNVKTSKSLSRWIGYSPLKQALQWLEKGGWIKVQKGRAKFQQGQGGKAQLSPGAGTLTRILPTPELAETFLKLQKDAESDLQLPPLGQEAEDAVFHFGRIKLMSSRDDMGPTCEIKTDSTDPLIEVLTERLEAFNRMNTQHEWVMELPHYSHLGTPAEGSCWTQISAPALVYSKTFNRESFEFNGRYYSKLTSIKRSHRLHITVNGKRLVEADFVSLHIRFAYDIEGIPVQCSDFYDLGEIGKRYLGHLHPLLRRQLTKCLMLSLLNKSKGSVLQGLNNLLHGSWENGKWKDGYWTTALKKIRETISHKIEYGISLTEKDQLEYPEQWDWEQDVKPAVGAIFEFHQAIAAKYLGKDWGLFFQHLDSRIADIVALRFTELAKPLLILHDGFFTSEENEDFLIATMYAAYTEVIGTALPRNAIETKRR